MTEPRACPSPIRQWAHDDPFLIVLTDVAWQHVLNELAMLPPRDPVGSAGHGPRCRCKDCVEERR